MVLRSLDLCPLALAVLTMASSGTANVPIIEKACHFGATVGKASDDRLVSHAGPTFPCRKTLVTGGRAEDISSNLLLKAKVVVKIEAEEANYSPASS